MSLLKEKFDPTQYKLWESSKNYPSLSKRYIILQTGKSQVNAIGLVFFGALLAGSVGLSLLWIPILLINAATILCWIVWPITRPINQKRDGYFRSSGTPGEYFSKQYGPTINWNLYDADELYSDAVHEWFQAVRDSGDVRIHEDQWSDYLNQTQSLTTRASASKRPDFEKLKLMKELMNDD